MTRPRAFLLLCAALATAAVATGCSDPTRSELVEDQPLPLTSATVESLAAARARWEAAGITHYRFTERRACFCGETRPVRIEVQRKAALPHHESLVSLTYEDGGGEPRPEVREWFYTVDQLFALIQTGLDADVELLVSYHPTYGYPTKVDVEPSQHPVDGGVLYTVSRFAIVERK